LRRERDAGGDPEGLVKLNEERKGGHSIGGAQSWHRIWFGP